MRNIIFIIIIIFIFVSPVYAQNDDIGESVINPASHLYFLKAVREVLELKFAATPDIKSIRQLEFATRRIREIKSLSGTSRQDLIEPTLAKYLSILQELSSEVNLSDEMMAVHITKAIVRHIEVLQTVYDRVTHPRARMSIRAAINRLAEKNVELIGKLNQLSKPHLAEKLTASQISACRFLSKEASSSALNETERSVLAKRGNKCFQELRSNSF